MVHGGATFGTVAAGVFDGRGLASGSGNRRSQLQVDTQGYVAGTKIGEEPEELKILDRMQKELTGIEH